MSTLDDNAVFAAVEGVRLEYRLIEAKERWAPTVVFLHEGLGSTGLWRDFPDKLCAATGCGALIYSRQGHGQSDPLPRSEAGTIPADVNYHVGESERILPTMLQELRIERPILFGHSDGATIALMFAARFPERTRGLILEAPHVFVEEITLKGIRRALKAYDQGDLKTGLLRHHKDPEGIFFRWYNTWTSAEFRHWNILRALPYISAPILAVQGDKDEYGSLDQLTQIRDSVAGYTDVMAIKGCHHTPHAEFPDIIIDRVLKFLEHCR